MTVLPLQLTISWPRRLNENPMLLSEITRSWGDDRSIADYDSVTQFDRLTHVVFAHEVGRLPGRRD